MKRQKMRRHKGIYLPTGLIVAGLLLMGLGIGQGELGVVLRKAIVICLECIGIG